jgi:hypothetical protein
VLVAQSIAVAFSSNSIVFVEGNAVQQDVMKIADSNAKLFKSSSCKLFNNVVRTYFFGEKTFTIVVCGERRKTKNSRFTTSFSSFFLVHSYRVPAGIQAISLASKQELRR